MNRVTALLVFMLASISLAAEQVVGTLTPATRVLGSGADFTTGKMAATSGDTVERQFLFNFTGKTSQIEFTFKYDPAMIQIKSYNANAANLMVICPNGSQAFISYNSTDMINIEQNKTYVFNAGKACNVNSFDANQQMIVLEQFKLK